MASTASIATISPTSTRGSKSTMGPRGSLGIVFIEGVTSGRLAVLTLTEGGPAAKDATIREGDLAVAVDGVSVIGRSLEELREIVSGPPGTECRLTMERPGEGRQFDVVLIRENMQRREELKKLEHERLIETESRLSQMETLRIRLETEVNRLTTQISESRAAFGTQLQAAQVQLQNEQGLRGRLEQQLAHLTSVSQQTSRELEQHREEVHRLRQELEQMTLKAREADRLKLELAAKEELERANQQLRERMNGLLQDARNENRLRIEAESEIKKLTLRLQQATEQVQALERRHSEAVTQLHSERAALEREKESALRELADLRARNTALQRDYDGAAQHVSRLEAENHKLNVDVHAVRKDNQSLQDRLRSETERLLQEIAAGTEARRNLERNLREATDELTSARLALDREKIELTAVRESLSKTMLEISSLQTQLEDARRAADERGAQVRELESWSNTMSHKINELQAALSASDSAQKRARLDLTAAREEVLRLQRELDILRNERDKIFTQSKDALSQAEINHKKEVFELQRHYESVIESTVKTSVDRANALDMELRAANSALAERGRRERHYASSVADIINNVHKSKLDVQEVDREVRFMMTKYRDRVMPTAFVGMNSSLDATRVSTASVRALSQRGANC